MLTGKSPWLIASLALAVSSTACETAEPTGCGRHDANGAIRFCAADGTQVCICQTERCAEHVENTVCPSTLRYVYGGACVPDAEVLPNLDPSNTSMMCDDTSGPRLSAPRSFGAGLAPRIVSFGDAFLLETVNDPAAAVDQRDAISVQAIGWNFESTDLQGSFDPYPGGDARVTEAMDYATCTNDRLAPWALFGHWRQDTESPLILSVVPGEGHLEVRDIAPDVFGAVTTNIRSFGIVGTGDGCWIVWTSERDAGSGIPAAVHAARMLPGGSPDLSASTMEETEAWVFGGVPGAMTDGNERRNELLAIDGGAGGVIVAVAAHNEGSGHVGLVGTRWRPGDAMRDWTSLGGNSGSLMLDIANSPGIEVPYRNAAAVAGTWVALAAVAPSADGKRHLYYGVASMVTGDGVALGVPVAGTEASSRIPSLVRLADNTVHVGFTGLWGGDFSGSGIPRLLSMTDTTNPMEPPYIDLATEEAVLPVLADDLSGGLFVLWLQTDTNVSLRLQRYTSARQVAVGWPATGLGIKDASRPMTGVGALPTMPAPLPLPGGDGAIITWSQDDGEGSVVYLRRVAWGSAP